MATCTQPIDQRTQPVPIQGSAVAIEGYGASPQAALAPFNVIFCDDVRREINGKEILIGVYSADVIVPTVPTTIPIALFVQLKVIDLNLGYKIKLKVVDPSGNRSGEIMFDSSIIDRNNPEARKLTTFAITLPPLPVVIVQPGKIKVYWEDEGGIYQLIGEKRVAIAHVSTTSTAPS